MLWGESVHRSAFSGQEGDEGEFDPLIELLQCFECGTFFCIVNNIIFYRTYVRYLRILGITISLSHGGAHLCWSWFRYCWLFMSSDRYLHRHSLTHGGCSGAKHAWSPGYNMDRTELQVHERASS